MIKFSCIGFYLETRRKVGLDVSSLIMNIRMCVTNISGLKLYTLQNSLKVCARNHTKRPSFNYS